ncbi:hypothetical protein MP638_003749 [Amoeboaphelidium occidentale]|nr:hypothetical protein MP638_003749 [Amoeboaphelidium occidentale]
MSILLNGLYIFGWYFFATCLSVLNKHMVSHELMNIPFPLLTSSIHSAMNWILAAICFKLLFRGIFEGSSHKLSTISPKVYFLRIFPVAITSALDIGLSNASLRFISLSMYTMVKSTVSLWALIFAFIFGLERPSISHFMIIILIVSGAAITFSGEIDLNYTGLAIITLATAISGLRWVLTQVVLQKKTLGLDHPVITIYYLSPIMFVALLCMSLLFESGHASLFQSIHTRDIVESQVASDEYFHHETKPAILFGLMSLGGVLAFFMTMSEFSLISATSVVTLCIAGICKELLTIFVAMIVYKDAMTPMKWLGLVITVTGILIYNLIRSHKHNNSNDNHRQYRILVDETVLPTNKAT